MPHLYVNFYYSYGIYYLHFLTPPILEALLWLVPSWGLALRVKVTPTPLEPGRCSRRGGL